MGGLWELLSSGHLGDGARGVKVVGLTGEYKNLEGAAIVANKRNAFKLEF